MIDEIIDSLIEVYVSIIDFFIFLYEIRIHIGFSLIMFQLQMNIIVYILRVFYGIEIF